MAWRASLAWASGNTVTCGRMPMSRGDLQEIAGIGAGHIGYAADCALAPQQLVVIELRACGPDEWR